MILRWIVLCLMVTSAAACVADIGPPRNLRGISIVSDINRADTIDARPITPILIQISDSTGSLNETVTVTIEGIPTGALDGSLGMYPLDEFGNPTTGLSLRNDGQASFRVMFGQRAGQAAVVVSVPELSLADTLWFTVRPGAPARVTPRPVDAAVLVGGSYQQSAAVLDRVGNERELSSPLTFSALDPAAAVSAGGQVTGLAYGRARIKVAYEAMTATAMVSVVPAGRLATVLLPSALGELTTVAVLGTDGSGLRRYPTPQNAGAAVWSADATRIYYVGAPRTGIQILRIYSLTLADGASTPLIPDTVSALSGVNLATPAVSLDGAWIYFTTLREFFSDPPSGDIWRVHPDGTGLTRPVIGGAGSPVRTSPSPSPDGTRLAYVEGGSETANYVKILDLQSGSTVTIPVPGAAEIRWSPTGDRIAIKNGTGVLYVMNVDGSQLTQLSPPTSYFIGLDWSRDGHWIVANLGGVPTILEPTTTGLRLPLSIPGVGDSWSPQ